MIQQPLILLHEESMRMTHPVFKVAPNHAKVIYVWDDEYLKRSAYSLKRLIFIYENLSEMEVTILRGDTSSILEEINPSIIYIPTTNNPLLLEIIHSIKKVFSIQMVEDEPFVVLSQPIKYSRFYQYWNKAEKKSFLCNGDLNA